MSKTIFEKLGGEYEQQGDYLIPHLTVPTEEEQAMGIWGQRHLDYPLLFLHLKKLYSQTIEMFLLVLLLGKYLLLFTNDL